MEENAILIAAMRQTGLKQTELAEAVNGILCARGYDGTVSDRTVRNWLTGPESGWDRHGSQPPPPLPEHIITATRDRYIDAYERISGLSFDDWIGCRA